jgi:long-chain fatty acid transport protein
MAVSALAALAGLTQAHAGAFGLREQSAAGQGSSFAGAAAGSAGLGSMFWNPATITMMPGIQFETDLSLISPYANFRPGTGSSAPYLSTQSGDVAQDALLPASYGSWQINDRFWVGYSLTTPFGLATKPDSTFAGRTYGDATKVGSINFTPTAAWKVNDWLAIGGGLQVMYFKARYMSFVPATREVLGLDGDSVGVGYTLGLTLTPMAGTSIGIGFRSAVQERLEGTFQGSSVIPTAPTRPFHANAVLPEQLTLGVRQAIGDQFTLQAGLEWTNWSRLRFPRVYNDATGTLLAANPFLPLGYKDGWFASLGGEYAVTQAWTVRAGLAYEKSPIETSVRNLRLSDNDRIWASVGASYQYNQKLTFDIGYSHIFPKDTQIAIVQGNPTWSAARGNLVGKVDAHVDIVSVALRYRWDDPAKPIPAALPAVVVRKP